LTFYKEEEFKLGYMVASNPKLELFGNKVVRKSVKSKKNWLQKEWLILPRKNTFENTLTKTIDYLSNRV
jgi:hypothetical protein